jgi:ankyrin repeat protein
MPSADRLNASMATVQVLLDHGMDVNAIGQGGTPLLGIAIVNGQTAWTEMLLQHGAKVNVAYPNGGTPLITAITSMGMVKEARYYAVLDELLARGADPNLGIDNPIVAKDGPSSALKTAICGLGSTDARRKTVALLLAHGARFSVPKGSDAEKMLLAATSGNADAVAQLLVKGVSPNVADGKGWTPLLSAASLGYGAVLKALVDAGADVNAHDALGLNALWFAMERYPDLADFHLLLDKGANVNADSDFMFYNPALYTAISQHDPALLADLLKHGASPNMLPGDHPNRLEPLEFAVDQLMENRTDPKRQEIVTALIAAGANRNPKQDGYRISLLYFPVENNMIDMVKFLLNAGIDPKNDADGGKALSDVLQRHGSKEMKSLLAAVLAPNAKPAK